MIKPPAPLPPERLLTAAEWHAHERRAEDRIRIAAGLLIAAAIIAAGFLWHALFGAWL